MFGRNATSRSRNMKRVVACSLAAMLVLPACSTVINDSSTTDAPEDTTPVVVTTTIPTGDITSLLAQLVSTANGLGEAIANRQNDQARQQASDALAIWSALQPQLLDTGIDVVEDIDRMVELMQTAVDRKRPADADKAYRFISLIAQEIPSLL
jgi:hypothetical protein